MQEIDFTTTFFVVAGPEIVRDTIRSYPSSYPPRRLRDTIFKKSPYPSNRIPQIVLYPSKSYRIPQSYPSIVSLNRIPRYNSI